MNGWFVVCSSALLLVVARRVLDDREVPPLRLPGAGGSPPRWWGQPLRPRLTACGRRCQRVYWGKWNILRAKEALLRLLTRRRTPPDCGQQKTSIASHRRDRRRNHRARVGDCICISSAARISCCIQSQKSSSFMSFRLNISMKLFATSVVPIEHYRYNILSFVKTETNDGLELIINQMEVEVICEAKRLYSHYCHMTV